MSKSITVSAPGKLMLFGEHAVVYGKPCLVTSVDQRLYTMVTMLDEPVFALEAEDVGVTGYRKPVTDVGKGDIPEGALFVETSIKHFLQKYSLKDGLCVTTKSQFFSKYGFGSSSASVVCTIKALEELFGVKLSPKELFDLSYKVVLDVQGKGSGFDVAAAIWGGVLYFVGKGKVIVPLEVKSLPLVVGYSGVKAETSLLIKKVGERKKRYPEIVKAMFDQIGLIVDQAKEVLIDKDWKKLGELMDINQGYLESLGIVTPKLVNMIHQARQAGAYGAKVSGAGGGDCMISLVSEEKRDAVEKNIEATGGRVVPVKINVEGVKVSKMLGPGSL